VSLLQDALAYHRRGWCVIPVNGKKPARGVKWKPYATQRPTEAELRAWFSHNGATGLAVVLGPVSGGLYCRDSDTPGAYERWKAGHAELAATLPTVKTARGYHVYFHSTAEHRIKNCKDGELRGVGSYVLLPPSQHPSGHVYKWLVELPSGDIPTVDPVNAGLVRDRTERQRHRDTEITASVSLSYADREGLNKAIAEVVGLALPRDVHQNHAALFTLARGVKMIEKRLGRPIAEQGLSEIFGLWHDAAKSWLRPEQTKQEYWTEFLEGYEKVKHPLDESTLQTAWETAQKSPLPKEAAQFEKPEIRLLVALCRELQRAAGNKAFYLPCRKVQMLMHPDSQDTAARWLRMLVRAKIVEVVERGGPDTNKATRYRYLLPLEG
jgi:hypothetical protein